jgi:hypothetical protein
MLACSLIQNNNKQPHTSTNTTQLIRLGLLDTLEAALRPTGAATATATAAEATTSHDNTSRRRRRSSSSSSSSNMTVRLCAAYCVNRLSRNARVAQLLAGRPGIVEGLLALLDAELLSDEAGGTGRFLGFRHSESHTSAEVACTLLEAISNILEAGGRDRSALLLLLGRRAQDAPPPPCPVTGTPPASTALSCLPHDLIGKLAALLRHLDLCDEHTASANRLFRDGRLAVYRRFFPHALDDEVRRRMREVEAEAARFLAALATSSSPSSSPPPPPPSALATAAAGTENEANEAASASASASASVVLLRRDVLQALAPLAASEARNASAFVPAARALHAVLDAYDRAAAEGRVHPPSDSGEALTDRSLLVDSHLNRRALAEAVAVAVDHPDDATLGAPFARLRSVGPMRLYTSSMACLIAGGLWGVLRTAMRRAGGRIVHPVVAYSVNGCGAVMLNVLVGTYGLRHALSARTYIEDDATNVAWAWVQAGVDVALVTAIVRKHPYSLLPMVVVNCLGHSSYPGTGLKSLDGLDIFALG